MVDRGDAKEVLRIQQRVIVNLLMTIESRDGSLGDHVEHTKDYAELIAREMQRQGLYPGELNERFVKGLCVAALVHDVGKIAVPESVLSKPGRLTQDEYELVKRHSLAGERMIRESMGSMEGVLGEDNDLIALICDVAAYHHERWDGGGYPCGLRGGEIPLGARIVAVADVFDALISRRCYKEPTQLPEAFEIIRQSAGGHFDPGVVDVFLQLRPELERVVEEEQEDEFYFEDNYRTHLRFFQKLPLGLAIVKVEVDEQGAPTALRLAYENESLGFMLGLPRQLLLGQDPCPYLGIDGVARMRQFWRVAYEGASDTLTASLPERGRYFSVSCYRPLQGYCGLVFQEITRQRELEEKNARSLRTLEIIFRNSVDIIFHVDLRTRVLHGDRDINVNHDILPDIADVPRGLLDAGLIYPDSLELIEDALAGLERGEALRTVELLARPNQKEPFRWYAVTLNLYRDLHSGVPYALCYMKDVHEGVLRRRQLEREAQRDGLTGLYNASTGRGLTENRLTDGGAGGGWNLLFLFDLDNFKAVNDTRGHEAGNRLLRGFAAVLRENFREWDILWRSGGDEFAAFLQCRRRETVGQRVSEIADSVMLGFRALPDNLAGASVSVGAAAGCQGARRFEDYFQAADEALYRSKRAGKNRCELAWLGAPAAAGEEGTAGVCAAHGAERSV